MWKIEEYDPFGHRHLPVSGTFKDQAEAEARARLLPPTDRTPETIIVVIPPKPCRPYQYHWEEGEVLYRPTLFEVIMLDEHGMTKEIALDEESCPNGFENIYEGLIGRLEFRNHTVHFARANQTSLALYLRGSAHDSS